uniref:PTTG protein n=1 Tax=Sinocyclocheilus rhinocerous TaxID=307959 RepID=A0A673NA00_9TELE
NNNIFLTSWKTNSSCSDYPVSYVIPPASVCKLSQARWGVCWVNFEALIIAMAVVCGTLLLAVSVCCCCCCCCCKRRRSSRARVNQRRFDLSSLLSSQVS